MPKVPKVGMNLIFYLQTNANVFYRLTVWVCEARHAQNTQTLILQYLKENIKDEVILLSVDKCQKFPQIDTIILGVCGQACPNYLK